MNKKLHISILLCFVCIHIFAQNDCRNYLENAKIEYEKGRFNEAIALLKNCSPSDSSEVSKWKVSRLLCQCYLGINDNQQALSSAQDMLEKNPTYKASLIEDNTEFLNLIHKVSVVPRFSLSLSIAVGLNISYPFIYTKYQISDYTKAYKNGKANQFGLYGGYSINRWLSIHMGALYAVNNYSLSYSLQQWNINYSESLNYLQAHIFARYQIKSRGKLKFFIQAGGWTGFLLQSNYSISRSDSGSVPESELRSIDNYTSRNHNIYGILGGVGLSYKIGEGNVFGEVNYQKSFSTLNVPDKRLDNLNLISRYYFVDDNLGINNLTFSIGYTFYLNYFVERSKNKK